MSQTPPIQCQRVKDCSKENRHWDGGLSLLMKATCVGLIVFAWTVMVGAIAPLANAKPLLCRTVNQHQVCILSVKRSAKNYWEYRASAQIDGERTPVEVYDCRRHVKVSQDGAQQPFQPDGAGPIICELLGA